MTTERFVVFDCEGSSCVGVLSVAPPSATAASVGVVIVVGGPQYRVGSHRQFALLARALARAGVPTLRFDYRGIGDSEGDPRSFESIGSDLACAVDALCREASVERVVLWGLCDGASAAFMYAAVDARIAGIVAVNPWARSTQGEATTRLRHYYLRRLVSADFWRKLVTGRVDARQASGELGATVRNASARSTTSSSPFLDRMEEGWRRYRRPALLLLSGNDLTAREFEAWLAADVNRKRLADGPLTKVLPFAGADHTFSSRTWRDAVASATLEWIVGTCRRS